MPNTNFKVDQEVNLLKISNNHQKEVIKRINTVVFRYGAAEEEEQTLTTKIYVTRLNHIRIAKLYIIHKTQQQKPRGNRAEADSGGRKSWHG